MKLNTHIPNEMEVISRAFFKFLNAQFFISALCLNISQFEDMALSAKRKIIKLYERVRMILYYFTLALFDSVLYSADKEPK